MEPCTLCPRMCKTDRDLRPGYCGADRRLLVAGTMLHHWEEPCISGHPEKGRGSGAVFFGGCPLHCVFCQNRGISLLARGEEYTESELGDLFLRLQEQGAYNLNLVSPTQYTDRILRALDSVRSRLIIPVIWNTGGYERAETVRRLRGYVDVFLTDFKYGSERSGEQYAKAPEYAQEAARSLQVMTELTGDPVYDRFPDEDSVGHAGSRMRKGTIVRHLVLPGESRDSLQVLDRIRDAVGNRKIVLALMSQYTPDFVEGRTDVPEALHRRITTLEMERVRNAALALGLDGYCQERSSAQKTFTPLFVL